MHIYFFINKRKKKKRVKTDRKIKEYLKIFN